MAPSYLECTWSCLVSLISHHLQATSCSPTAVPGSAGGEEAPSSLSCAHAEHRPSQLTLVGASERGAYAFPGGLWGWGLRVACRTVISSDAQNVHRSSHMQLHGKAEKCGRQQVGCCGTHTNVSLGFQNYPLVL